MTVNAFALGRHTVAINQGAIEAFTPQELQGIIAHEIGHIAHGHTKALLLNVVGNGIFTLIVILMQVMMFVIDLIVGIITQNIISDIFFLLCRFILKIVILVFSLIGLLITAINSRQNEYQADKFALDIGFGEEIIGGLYFLQKMDFGSNMSIIEKLKSSHPHINERIMKLESMGEPS